MAISEIVQLTVSLVAAATMLAGLIHLFYRPDVARAKVSIAGWNLDLPSTSITLVAIGGIVLSIQLLIPTRSHSPPVAAPDKIAQRIDSGYSRTIVFAGKEMIPGGTTSISSTDRAMMFYAEVGQDVHATVHAYSDAPQSKLRILVDNQTWQPSIESSLPIAVTHANITDKLRFDTQPGSNLHVISFTPDGLQGTGKMVVQVTILVYNGKKER